MINKLWLFLIPALLCCACCRTPGGHIQLNFSFVVDNDSLRLDTCMYQNAAGNLYEVNDVQFFISHVMLETASGEVVKITDNQGIHYTDIRIPGTLTWDIADMVPADEYKSISFVFGLEGDQNTTGFFPNPPENNMSWPDMIGGGYHYMKINGRWIDPEGVRQPFNLHTGKTATDNGFADNTFTVTLPLSQFAVIHKETAELTLQMNVNAWFSNPYLFDLNVFGGSIMQNREAQELLRSNGRDVFSVK
jgi:hypothetical protein